MHNRNRTLHSDVSYNYNYNSEYYLWHFISQSFTVCKHKQIPGGVGSMETEEEVQGRETDVNVE